MHKALFDGAHKRVLSIYQVGSLRILISGVALTPIVIRRWKEVPPEAWKWMVAVGLFGSTIPAFLFPAAQQYLPSNVAGILNSLTPVFTMILGFFVFKALVNRSQVAGILIGLLGAGWVIYVTKPGGTLTTDAILPALFIVLATMMYAVSVNVMRYRLIGIPPLLITSGALSMMAIPSGIIFWLTNPGEVVDTNPHAWNSFAAVLILSLFSTAIATVLFNRLIQMTNALFASSVTYIMPVFAALWGLVLGESVPWTVVIGAAIILTGVYLINRKPISV
jgi:drug/metabolite transporter (DMT)-like permease